MSMSTIATLPPWLTIAESAAYQKTGKRLVCREIKAGRLKAVAIGGRRELRTRREWLD
jgi:excisionase family DNA binding protein